MPRKKDIWRCGISRRSIAEIVVSGEIGNDVVWLPVEPEFEFTADPFGHWVDDQLHVFVEHYDYRSRHGVIRKLLYDQELNLVGQMRCLSEPWHLSYPQIFQGEGQMWMLPEGYRSGHLTIYRDHGGLTDWRPEYRLALDFVPVDASILHHQDRWWLFYSPATSKGSRKGHLHVAWAERLCGPWTTHPGNPVRVDPGSSRPGGTPVVIDGRVMLPVQDCRVTYGGGVRPLWVEQLDEKSFVAEAGAPISLPTSAGSFTDGMHTLSACGDLTLFDVKRIDRSYRGLFIDFRRMLREFDRL